MKEISVWIAVVIIVVPALLLIENKIIEKNKKKHIDT